LLLSLLLLLLNYHYHHYFIILINVEQNWSYLFCAEQKLTE